MQRPFPIARTKKRNPSELRCNKKILISQENNAIYVPELALPADRDGIKRVAADPLYI
jgi:hypothetical protein